MTAQPLLAVSNTTTELSSEENELLLSAINLSSQEKSVQAELKDVKAKVTELFRNRFDVANTGTIAKLGKSSIQVKRKAGKKELPEELLQLQENLEHRKQLKLSENAGAIAILEKEIDKLKTDESIQFLEFDFKQRVAALPEPEATYEVAIKV